MIIVLQIPKQANNKFLIIFIYLYQFILYIFSILFIPNVLILRSIKWLVLHLVSFILKY